MIGSGVGLTLEHRRRSGGDGAFCGFGRFGGGDVGLRGRRCRQGPVRAEGADRAGGHCRAADIDRRRLCQDRDRGWPAIAVAGERPDRGGPAGRVRHMKALLKAQQVNKSDRNDARGIAQMMRVGLFKPVHVKTLIAQEQRMLLTSRKLVQRKLMDIESDMRGTLRNFGLKVGVVSSIRYEARISDMVEGFPRLAAIIEPLLTVRRVMRQQLATLHKLLLNAVRVDPVCRRFMTVPGVGPIVALTYRASVDQPHRFIHSRAVGAHVGLTPKRHQSGEIDYDGGVSKCGDSMLRAMLYEAAQSMLTHSKKWSWLKAWGMRVAQRRGMRRAIVAVGHLQKPPGALLGIMIPWS